LQAAECVALEVRERSGLEPITNPVPVQRDQLARHKVVDEADAVDAAASVL
jgi:hypothetical protein